jgi:hypothetical protein
MTTTAAATTRATALLLSTFLAGIRLAILEHGFKTTAEVKNAPL